MGKQRRTYRRTYIRAWREFRGLGLARLAERMVDPESGAPLLSIVSLSRIERGIQPYSQPTLEAIAEALGCEPPDLLMRNPQDTEAPWSIWDQLKPVEKRQAIEMLKLLRRDTEAA